MNKVSITLEVSNFNKAKIKERTFKQNGVDVTVKEYMVDLIPLKEPKVIKETDTYIMTKTHFVAEAQTKEERAAKKDTVFVGSGITFKNKEEGQDDGSQGDYPSEDINAEDIPF